MDKVNPNATEPKRRQNRGSKGAREKIPTPNIIPDNLDPSKLGVGNRDSPINQDSVPLGVFGSPTIRIAELDFTRATEQCAILSSLYMGRGSRVGLYSKPAVRELGDRADNRRPIPQARTIAIHSLNYCLGYLEETSNHVEIRGFHVTHRQKKPSNKAQDCDELLNTKCVRGAYALNQKPDLEVVLSPLDGATDLLQGHDGGAVSVISGGPPGTFCECLNNSERYMVFALSPELTERLRQDSRGERQTATAFEHELENAARSAIIDGQYEKLITQVQLLSGKKNAELTFGTMQEPEDAGKSAPKLPIMKMIRAKLGLSCRVHAFFGSPVAAAIATCLPRIRIDAFLGPVSKPQATLIAAAACSTECWFRAFDITDLTDNPQKDGTQIFSSSSFVKQPQDVFVIATGISENLALKGVRFHGPDNATTHTLCLHSSTGSIRFINNEHKLTRRRFRAFRSDAPVSYEQLTAI